MDLLLNYVLNLSDEEIANSKIEFNMQAGSRGQSFMDRWLKHTDKEKSTAFVRIVHIGDGMENNAISIQNKSFSALRESPQTNGYLSPQLRLSILLKMIGR